MVLAPVGTLDWFVFVVLLVLVLSCYRQRRKQVEGHITGYGSPDWRATHEAAPYTAPAVMVHPSPEPEHRVVEGSYQRQKLCSDIERKHSLAGNSMCSRHRLMACADWCVSKLLVASILTYSRLIQNVMPHIHKQIQALTSRQAA